MKNIEELIKVCEELNVDYRELSQKDSSDYINQIVKKYNVQKTSGHLSIYHNSISIPIEKHEYSYSDYLKDEPIYIFFDQENHNKNTVLIIYEGKKIGQIMRNSYGMEYFLSNKNGDYLLAINWYVIEGAGSAVEWLSQLREI